MKIVVCGRGNVGSALGESAAELGHVVTYAVRDPSRADETAIPGGADDADVVILAVPFAVAADTAALLAPGKSTIVVDATNPFGAPLPSGAASGAATIAGALGPGVRLVKAFNVLGAENMREPQFPAGRALLPVAGDDDEARQTVVELARAMGYEAVAVGGLANAGLLEEAARYWGLLAFAGGLGRHFALGALTR